MKSRAAHRALVVFVTGTFLALAAAPLASAQAPDEAQRKTSFVTFYGHVFDANRFNPMPMNVEFPWGEEDFSAGYGDSCGVSALDPVAPIQAPVLLNVNGDCETNPYNEVWFYSTAGFVDIVDSNDFDYEKIHNERGLTKDTFLDTTQDITATVYMSADGHAWSTLFCNLSGLKPYDVPEPFGCWNWDPGTLRGWTVRATVYVGVLGEYGGEANTAPDIATAFADNKLEVLAEGVSAPVDVVSMEAAGQPTVWKFDVNLGKAQTSVIPKEKSYLVRFKFWSDFGGNKVVLPPNWNLNSGELYPTSITIPVKNAFDVESVIPQFVHDKLVILGILNTPWGSYDVDQDSVKLTITSKTGQEITPVRIEKLADYSVAHGGHYKPVNVTYVWDYRADKLPAGEYVARVSATNFQGSASSECAGRFTVLENGRPGAITVGECAVRTLTEEQLREIQQGAEREAGTGGGADDGPSAKLPDLPLSVAAASATPVAAAPAALHMALALLAACGAVLARRGWSS